ncbi:hypothetical protein ATANTOWER_016866 [Ataeniobius toweri]|uniref:Uncharacterized protein n=1 Tax=Ataeniobius toweri TaxID=208326 RepID=A0ABU7BHQ5_9TELE|nr:hypothetical protein [Ataeniobius toweri]
MCNSECEEPQTRPPGPGTDKEEIQATNIQRPLRAQEHRENHCRDYCNPSRDEQGRIPGEPPSSHNAEAPGSCSGGWSDLSASDLSMYQDVPFEPIGKFKRQLIV